MKTLAGKTRSADGCGVAMPGSTGTVFQRTGRCDLIMVKRVFWALDAEQHDGVVMAQARTSAARSGRPRRSKRKDSHSAPSRLDQQQSTGLQVGAEAA
ncbi:hypothetical protein CCR96_08635 [Halochromatium roseum]|nr:hypothetical protein [Halochromatium roseum]